MNQEDWKTTSTAKRRDSTIWQRRFWEHLIRDTEDYRKHLDYIHYNPLYHGLVKNVQDWPYSTFHRYVREGLYEREWGDSEIEFDENSGISYALSAEVIESKLILKKQKAIDFNLSKNLKKDTYFFQRSIEFNYPIRINEISRFVLFLNEEYVPSTCKVIETGKHVKLAQC